MDWQNKEPIDQAEIQIKEIIEEEKAKMKIEVDEEKLETILTYYGIAGRPEIASTLATRISDWAKIV